MLCSARVVSRRIKFPQQSRKQLSSFSFLGGSGGDDFEYWPRSHPNTFLNVCPQGELMIVERLGKLHSIQQAGLFVSIPVIDNIRFRIDVSFLALFYLNMFCCVSILTIVVSFDR